MTGSRAIDATINSLAAATCSVVHARDLRDAGIGRAAVLSRVRAGQMAPILPRTYAVGPTCSAPTFEMLCMAGVLSCGDGSAIDGDTAATLLGVWNRGDRLVHVAVPGQSRRGAPPPFRMHRMAADWEPTGPLAHGPVPLAGFADICLCMARWSTAWQVAHVIGRGIYEGLVTLDELDRWLHARGPAHGAAVLRRAIALVRSGSAGTRTRTEDELLRVLRSARVPEPVVNTRGALGLSRDEPDFFWPRARLNVEVDGRQHSEPAQTADDAHRDAEAAALGIRVLRVPWEHVWRRPNSVVRAIRRALAPAGGACATVVVDRSFSAND